jgi:hypothetical protein
MSNLDDKVGDMTYSYQINTPDGQMWVHICEENDKPIMIIVNIGKSGSVIQAWASATAYLVTELLKYTSYHRVIELVSNITTDKIKLGPGTIIRSGPDGIATALMRYSNEKFKQTATQQTDASISRRLLD